MEYNSRCLPPWSDRELRHKLSEARKVTHCEPAGHLIGNRSNLSCRPEPDKPPRILGRITLREKSVALAESHPVEVESCKPILRSTLRELKILRLAGLLSSW